MSPSLELVANKQTHLVVETVSRRVLGGVSIGHYRPWVFPLYTPGGLTVVEEAPADHPFHSGVFVGQHPVRTSRGQANFWGTPPARMADDHLQRDLGRVVASAPQLRDSHSGSLVVRLSCTWVDAEEEPVLDEVRTIVWSTGEGATCCDVVSERTASYGDVVLERTKFASVGARVEPRLLPDLGAVVIGDGGRRGRSDVVHEQSSDFVAFENDVPGYGVAGLLLSRPPGSAAGTWFVRDYGMAVLNASLHADTVLPTGSVDRVALRVTAYDGPLDEGRARTLVEAPTYGDTITEEMEHA